MKIVQVRVSAEVRDALMAEYYKLTGQRPTIREWLDEQIRDVLAKGAVK